MACLRASRLPALLVLLLSLVACKEDGTGVEVKSLKIAGHKAVSDGQVRSVLATAVSSKLPWGDKQYFDRRQFEADLKRIVAFYHDRGYPDARIKSYDAKLSGDQKSVDLRIEIEEGQPIRVEKVILQGLDALPKEHLRELETRLPLKAGAPLDRALVQSSREAAVDELKDHGYPYPSVEVKEDPGSSDRLRVITYTAQPGRLAYVDRVEINGNSSVNDRIVRRQLTFRRGQLFQQSKLRESQRRLYTLELFNFANVEALPIAPQPGDGNGANTATAGAAAAPPPVANGQPADADRIPTRVTVTEGKHRKVNFGFGYGTEERVRGEIDWRHVNFFGGARTAGIFARYSYLDRGVRLNFRQPYFFGPHYSFGMSGQSWFSDEPAYKLTTVGGRATVTRQFGRAGRPILGGKPTTTVALTYANEWEDYTISDEALQDPTFRDDLIALGLDPRTGTGRGRLSALILDAGRNTADNLLDSKKGYALIGHYESAGKWLGGDWDYREFSAEGRYYQSIGSRLVVALRARGGTIDSSNPEVLVPFFKRYFLGGATNLRGWGRYEVSPLSGSGLPIGGHTFTNFSTELRVPLFGNFAGVAFFDGGNVWENPWDFNLNDLRYDVGPGIRYNTPVGPLRLDVGFQLNPIPGLIVNGAPQTRAMRIHFSIGQAF
jgi:outer membrane protein assembly factor BamA